MTIKLYRNIFLLAGVLLANSLLGEDYFRKYAGGIPVKVRYLKSTATRSMELRGLDTQKGIVYAKMEGGGTIELQLRDLRNQNIDRFELQWPKGVKTYLQYLANEQYDPLSLKH